MMWLSESARLYRMAARRATVARWLIVWGDRLNRTAGQLFDEGDRRS